MDVRERLESIARLAADAIRGLPEQSAEEPAKVGERTYAFITWHDEVSPGRHRIVVARYDKTMGTVYADGFVLEPDDSRSPLTRDELLPFV